MYSIIRNEYRIVDLTGLTCTLVVALLVGYILIGGNFRRIATLRDEQQALTVQLEHFTELTAILGQSEEALEILQAGMDEIDRRLPITMDFEQFYTDLTTLATTNHVLISNMRLGEIQSEDSFVELPITISATATFEDFHEFLYGLTNQTRLTKLNSLTIEISNDPNHCDIDMVVGIYKSKENSS